MRKELSAFLFLLPVLAYAGITNSEYWKEINYGWVCPTGMDLTAETIYSNTNKIQIDAADMIELRLGMWERRLATQTGSNTYAAPPYAFSETFYELIYTNEMDGTNLVDIIVTNSITKTNVVGYYPDTSWVYYYETNFFGGVYADSNLFDEQLYSDYYANRGVIENYVQSTSVSNGTTNIANYVAAELYTDLGLDWRSINPDYGWGPGLMTVPDLGVSVFTNYLICYTQYNASFKAVTQEYLSPSSQYVNFAYSFSVTNGITNLVYTNAWLGSPHVVNFTNYPLYQMDYLLSSASNKMALWLALGGGTYWERYPFYEVDDWFADARAYNRPHIYKEVFFDRYKLLNALQYTAPTHGATGFSRTVTLSRNNTDMAGLAALKAEAEAAFSTNALVAEAQTPYAYAQITRDGTAPTNLYWKVTLKRSYGVWRTGYVNTNVLHERPQAYVRGRVSSALWTFANQGDTVNSTNSYTLTAESVESDARTNYTFIVGTESLPAPTDWPDTPTNNATWTKGYLTDATDRKVVVKWNFIYCTNRYLE